MNDMQASLLWQLMQSMGVEFPAQAPTAQECPAELPPPWDMLYSLRPMLPPREQLFIDLMVKIHEIKNLLAEIQSGRL